MSSARTTSMAARSPASTPASNRLEGMSASVGLSVRSSVSSDTRRQLKKALAQLKSSQTLVKLLQKERLAILSRPLDFDLGSFVVCDELSGLSVAVERNAEVHCKTAESARKESMASRQRAIADNGNSSFNVELGRLGLLLRPAVQLRHKTSDAFESNIDIEERNACGLDSISPVEPQSMDASTSDNTLLTSQHMDADKVDRSGGDLVSRLLKIADNVSIHQPHTKNTLWTTLGMTDDDEDALSQLSTESNVLEESQHSISHACQNQQPKQRIDKNTENKDLYQTEEKEEVFRISEALNKHPNSVQLHSLDDHSLGYRSLRTALTIPDLDRPLTAMNGRIPWSTECGNSMVVDLLSLVDMIDEQ